VHELSLATAIVRTASDHASGRRVALVSLRIGSLRQAVPRSLGFYFEVAARDSLCEGARLDQERVGALLRCEACGAQWDPAPPPAHTTEALVPRFRCPACDGARSEIVRGDELEVSSIEVYDDPAEIDQRATEARCTAPR
jgi:hydrogenase nickel incorporation protein HypA/HybF